MWSADSPHPRRMVQCAGKGSGDFSMQGSGITIGTRGSDLALRQTQLVSDWIRARFPDLDIRVRTIKTEADRFQDKSIASLGDKGVFVRAIERALLDGIVDLAVHSLKDVPADTETPGLALSAFSPRSDPRDVFITRPGGTFLTIPAGSRIGTSSPRRRVQLRHVRPDLEYRDIRGNVDTRVRKLDEGLYDGIVLAAAGLQRLGLHDRITEYFDVSRCVPDAGQGIIAMQTREVGPARTIVSAIDDIQSRACALAERAVVRALGADCHSPVGAFAEVDGDRIRVRGVAALTVEGDAFREEAVGSASRAESIGTDLGARLLAILGGG